MQVSKVSFSGIYDVTFPKNTKDSEISSISNNLNNYATECGFKDFVTIVNYNDFLNSKNQNKRGFRIVTSVDNPHLLVNLFSKSSDRLSGLLNKVLSDKSSLSILLSLFLFFISKSI